MEKLSFRPLAESRSVSVRRSVGRNGGTLTSISLDEKRFMNMSAPYAILNSQPTVTITENTAHTNVMLQQGSKAVSAVTKEQITAEIKYQASIAPFRQMLKKGQISAEDYRAIDTILAEKYCPLFIQYISPN